MAARNFKYSFSFIHQWLYSPGLVFSFVIFFAQVSFGHDGPDLDMALHTITYMRIIFVSEAAQFVS
jgi:hypothetical protein